MDQMDPMIKELVLESTFSAAVLGAVTGDTVEYALIPLDTEGNPTSDEQADAFREKGFFFAGVCGYVNGYADSRLEPGLDPWKVMCAAAIPFLNLLRERLTPAPTGDSVDWLTELWSKIDPRDN